MEHTAAVSANQMLHAVVLTPQHLTNNQCQCQFTSVVVVYLKSSEITNVSELSLTLLHYPISRVSHFAVYIFC